MTTRSRIGHYKGGVPRGNGWPPVTLTHGSAPMTRYSLLEVTAHLTKNAPNDVARALAIYQFVRDAIPFGFTPAFDQAPPEQTLKLGRGHCNPKGALFVAMLRAANIPARLHFVDIANDVLRGLFPAQGGPPSVLNHAFTEVFLNNQWCRVDGYVVDTPLYEAARRRLLKEERPLGYGIHIEGTIRWTGTTDCLIQYADPASITLADHGPFEDPAAFYQSPAYTQDPGPLARRLVGPLVTRLVNARIEQVRQG